MLQLIINGIVADLPSDPKVAITYEANNIGNLADRNGSFANTFDLPLTGNNRNIFGLSDQIGSAFDTGATLPVQAFYTNWLIFEGVCRVVRYFGNNLQVELIGGVGTLVEAFQNTTLTDIKYRRLATLSVNPDDGYDFPSGNVVAGRVDTGAWGQNPQFEGGFGPAPDSRMTVYTEMVPLWYLLSDLVQDVFDDLGISLAGTLLTDGRLDDIYMMQGRWGQDREVQAGLVTGSYPTFTFTNAFLNWADRDYRFNFDTTNTPYGIIADDALLVPAGLSGAMFKVTWTHNIGSVIVGYELDPADVEVQFIQETYYNGLLIAQSRTERTFAVGTYNDVQLVSNYEFTLATIGTMQLSGATGGKVYFRFWVAMRSTTSMGGAFGRITLADNQHRVEITPIDRQVSDTIQRPQDKLPAITISNLILELCQRFGYTVSYDDRTKTIEFLPQSNLDNRTLAIDWNGKAESPLDSQFGTQYQTEFVFGDYGAINEYKSADGVDTGILLANVSNTKTAEAYTSIADIPTLSSLQGIDYSIVTATETSEVIKSVVQDKSYLAGDVVHYRGNWWKAKVNTTVTTTQVPGRYFVVANTTIGVRLDSDWELIPATSAFSTTDSVYLGKRITTGAGIFQLQNEFIGFGSILSLAPRFSPEGLTWQYSIDRYYQWLSAILSSPRIHKVLVRIRPTDLPLSFDKPIYWNQAYWYLVSVQDFNPMTGENTVCVLAQIPDYPTR